MLKAWENDKALMRPISLFQQDDNSISFMYRVLGEGTRLLSLVQPGDEVEFLGPLGNGFPVDEVSGKVALVGGGIGIPPMYETAKYLVAKGVAVDIFLGYRDEIFGLSYFEDLGASIFVACESGEEGFKGYVTQILKPENYQAVFACGPEPMLASLKNLCQKANVPAWLSMEKRMACGIGACLVCTCKTTEGNKRCCKDGPIFNADDLIF